MRTLSTIPTSQGPPVPLRVRPSLRRRPPGAGCRNLGGPLGAFARPGGMRTDRRIEPLAASAVNAARMAHAANPLIEITPTPEEYHQLCHDLAKLRKLGSLSNTAAVLTAVHAAAASRMGHDKSKNAGRR